MMRRMPWTRSLLAGLLGAAAVASGIGILAARTEGRTDSRVLPLDKGKKKLYGYTAAEWAAQWCQWAWSIPVAVHPLFDETGEFVEVGQHGPVWFLGGVFNESGAAVRTATIPAGKALFFPVLNFTAYQTLEPPNDPMEVMRQTAGEFMGLTVPGSLFVTVDGIPIDGIERGRVAADILDLAMPADNIPSAFGTPYARQVAGPGVTDGYWAMLRPLEPGEHVIHSGGSFDAPLNFTIDITYYLTVVESNRP